MKKRSFTLLEVLVGVSLTALIIGMLMTHFIQSSKLKNQIEQLTTEVLKRKLIQERLTYIFTHLSGNLTCEEKKLSFSFFPNEQEKDPVKATLEHNDQSLLLMYTLDEKKIEEHIGSKIKAIRWEFLSQECSTPLAKTWKANDTGLLSIRLTLQDEKDEEIQYAFFPNISPPTLKVTS